DPATRARIRDEMARPGRGWENLYEAAGGADGVLLVSFKKESLKPLTGKTLAQVARERRTDPRDVAMDLVAEDESRVGMIVYGRPVIVDGEHTDARPGRVVRGPGAQRR